MKLLTEGTRRSYLTYLRRKRLIESNMIRLSNSYQDWVERLVRRRGELVSGVSQACSNLVTDTSKDVLHEYAGTIKCGRAAE